jgi:hypothetical protein
MWLFLGAGEASSDTDRESTRESCEQGCTFCTFVSNFDIPIHTKHTGKYSQEVKSIEVFLNR